MVVVANEQEGGRRKEGRKEGRKGGRKEEGRKEGRQATNIKSNNPHLAGGEKTELPNLFINLNRLMVS